MHFLFRCSPNPRFKGFPSLEEAEKAYKNGKSSSATAGAKTAGKGIVQEKAPHTADVMIYSDGACRGNPGEAGSGVAIYRKDTLSQLWYGLYDVNGTNNTAELKALYQALVFAKEELAKGNTVCIFCDSEYAIGSATKWAKKWERNHWMDGNTPRKNAEIIKPIHFLYQELKGQLAIVHVRGHRGIEGNELADRMAMLAIDSQESTFELYRDQLDIEQILSLSPG